MTITIEYDTFDEAQFLLACVRQQAEDMHIDVKTKPSAVFKEKYSGKKHDPQVDAWVEMIKNDRR